MLSQDLKLFVERWGRYKSPCNFEGTGISRSYTTAVPPASRGALISKGNIFLLIRSWNKPPKGLAVKGHNFFV